MTLIVCLILAASGILWAADSVLLRYRRGGEGEEALATPAVFRIAKGVFLLALLPGVYLLRQDFDFELAMVLAAGFTGVIWLLDRFWWAPARGRAGAAEADPTLVEYSRSFFPIIVLVLVLRSFVFEPFRIPSSSMLPTLRIGDFIFVNKYSYGLRMPVTKSKFLDVGDPGRGDVVVFRLPSQPKTNYIKRLVGLPGDTVRYQDKRIYINGEPVDLSIRGDYQGPGAGGALLAVETLSDVQHEVLLSKGRFGREGEFVVPAGHYFMMGDNRDNSRDSRYDGVGFVPEENLVGKAVMIWMNWDVSNSGPDWGRIGNRIE
jgi:signal peptidase I